MPAKLSEGQHATAVAALARKGIEFLNRLEQARAQSPQNPNLSTPEWEVLVAFDLHSVEAICRRMNERALLAAYDGAPGALTELHVERAEASPSDAQMPNRQLGDSENCQSVLLEAKISYDPDGDRTYLRFMVTRWQIAHSEDQELIATRKSGYYSLVYHARAGRVVQREYGTIGQAPGKATATHEVSREVVPLSSP